MVVGQKPAEGEVAPDEGESESDGHEGIVGREQLFRDFIGFFGSLVGLIGFGLGILPASTVAERFLVTIAAVALSCAITLAVRLVRWSRTSGWLAVSSAVGVISLAALSVLVQQDPHSAIAADGQSDSGTSNTIVQNAPSASNSRTSTPGGGQATSPPLAGIIPSQQTAYEKLYETAFDMLGDNCQRGNVEFASYVDFNEKLAKVTVIGTPSSNGGGNVEISCNAMQASLQFEDQVARVSGRPTPEQCAAAAATIPVSARIPFSQLHPGDEFCFVTGSPGAPGPLIWATLKTVSGSPTFMTAWTATAWSVPSTS